MGTGIDTSTASTNAHGPGRALVRRTTVRVSDLRSLEGLLTWLRREAQRRLLARDPQTSIIRRAVGWSSLAGAALGVVLAFVASEPEDTGRATAGGRSMPALALPHRPLARQTSPGPTPGANREPLRASALPPLAPPAPNTARLQDDPARSAPDRELAVGETPSLPSAPEREAPTGADTPLVPRVDGPRQTTAAPSAPPAAVPAERAASSKARRREGSAPPAPLAKAGATGAHAADADELVWLAERAFQAGHAAEAVRLGQKALAAGAGARAQLTIAGAYFDMREFDRARAAYEAVLAQEPGNQAARTGLDISRSAVARSVARAP